MLSEKVLKESFGEKPLKERLRVKRGEGLRKRALTLLTAFSLALPVAAAAMPATAYAEETDGNSIVSIYGPEIYSEPVMYDAPVVKYTEFYIDVYSDKELTKKIGEIDRCSAVTVEGYYSMAQHWEGTVNTRTLEYAQKDYYYEYFCYIIDYNGTTAYVEAAGRSTSKTALKIAWKDSYAETALGQGERMSALNTDEGLAALADAWEAAGIEDYAKIIRDVHVYKTLAIEDMTFAQAALYLGAKVNDPATYDVNEGVLVSYGTASDEALAKADEILAQITNDSMSDYEKVKAVHDWMCENITNDWEAFTNNDTQGTSIPDADGTEDGALLSGMAVCEGYANTFQLFMNKLGIECLKMNAVATGAYGKGLHAWNMVKVGDQWYHIDVTYDDPHYADGSSHTRYKYFLVSDDTIGANQFDWHRILSCPSDYGA